MIVSQQNVNAFQTNVNFNVFNSHTLGSSSALGIWQQIGTSFVIHHLWHSCLHLSTQDSIQQGFASNYNTVGTRSFKWHSSHKVIAIIFNLIGYWIETQQFCTQIRNKTTRNDTTASCWRYNCPHSQSLHSWISKSKEIEKIFAREETCYMCDNKWWNGSWWTYSSHKARNKGKITPSKLQVEQGLAAPPLLFPLQVLSLQRVISTPTCAICHFGYSIENRQLSEFGEKKMLILPFIFLFRCIDFESKEF